MKLLVITSRFPYPIEKGDKLRAFHQIRELAVDHDVTLVALSEGPVDPWDLAKVRAECCEQIHVIERSRATTVWSVLRAVLAGVPLQVGYFQSAAAAAAIDEIIATVQPDHIYCQLIRTAPFGRDRAVPTTIDYQDAFSAAAQRRADRSNPLVRRVFSIEAARIRRYEEQAFGWFDHHVVISAQDRDQFHFAGADRIEIVTNGVDTTYFHPMEAPADRRDIAFVGNLGYPPNVDAAGLLIGEILPLVRARRPDTDVLLAGARPHRSVRQLEGPGVEVSGWLDDIRTAYARARIMVAPLMIGAGQQNKILEAMAMGVPCVTTPLVNSAIGGRHGEELMIASTPEEFAAHAVELLDSPETRRAMADRAQRFVQDRYSWVSVGEQLTRVFESPTSRRPPPSVGDQRWND